MNQHEDSKDNSQLLECITRLLGGLGNVRASLVNLATTAANERRPDLALSIHSAEKALDRCELEIYSVLSATPGLPPSKTREPKKDSGGGPPEGA